MSIVNVKTELLTDGGNNIKKYKEDNDAYYNNIKSLSINSCPSFDNFKNELDNKYNVYTTHCDIISSKLIECATELENTDNTISGNNSMSTESETNISTYSTEILNTHLITNIESLINLSDSERMQIFNVLSASLTTVVSNIENGNSTNEVNSEYELVNELVDSFVEQVSTANDDGTVSYEVNDLIKNNYYNEVVKEYGELANIKITPNMLHYASRNGLPLIRENNNLTITESHNACNIGDEYNFYQMGTAYMDETTSQYSSELYKNTGSYGRKYSYYPDGMTGLHINSKNWYICDDGFYRDADGYIICADRYNMGYNEDGTVRNVYQIIEDGSNKAIIVDTPFGQGKVYDWCEQGNIDIYVHR